MIYKTEDRATQTTLKSSGELRCFGIDWCHKLWNIRSSEIYILDMHVLLECCYI